MKNFIAVCVLLFCFVNVYGQFQKEAEYNSRSVKRMLLQDQTERYLFYDLEGSQIKIADANHQLIDSIQVPVCDGTFVIDSARSDFEDTELGVLCNCRRTFDDTDPYLVSLEGNIMIDFDVFPIIDDRYIIDFDTLNYSTTIYQTQTMELVTEIPQLRLVLTPSFYLDDIYYFGYNGIDKIFIFNESLDIIREIDFLFDSISNRISLNGASVIKDDETLFYMVVNEFDTDAAEYIYVKLIDEVGETLVSYDELFGLFHKSDQNLLYLSFNFSDVTSYNLLTEESKSVSSSFDGSTTLYQHGEYSIIKYIGNSGIVEFYDDALEPSCISQIQSNISANPTPFYDHLGNEYFWYSPLLASPSTSNIYKDKIPFQEIENSRSLSISNLNGLPTKILSRSSTINELTEVYSLGLTSTKDLGVASFDISPNPVIDLLAISSDETFKSFSIFNSTGALIREGDVLGRTFTIDVSLVKSGIYFLKLISDNGSSQTEKFIKVY